jgi:Cu(I)/Ag(I) efflux system membrane fusion protein
MNPEKNKSLVATAALVLLALGVAGGYWWAKDGEGEDVPGTASGAKSATGPSGREVLYWYDPMAPDQHFDKPGKSPFMDMELVPKYADEAAAGGVRIDPGLQQSIGIRTEKIERGRLGVELRVPATLTWDLREEFVVSARVDSIISRLDIKAPYDRVRRGQTLATVLAPQWGTALAEADALRRADSEAARGLRSAAQQRLHALGVPDGARVARDGSVALTSPVDGVVSEIMAREGQTVMAGMPLFRVNGTATLWLEAEIPQVASGAIKPGIGVEATVSAVPGETFEGEVETLLPQVDPATRTQRARIVLRNEQGLLSPGMFAELRLTPGGGDEVPLVPNGALIATGTDSRVIVLGDDGDFRPVRVRTGRSGGGRTEVLDGLEGGERVVTSGQFLIDSEASLSGLLERLGSTEGGGAEGDSGKTGVDGAAALHEADATIVSIENDKVRLKHGPFRTLDMPGMTMSFPLAGPDVAKGLGAGERVRVYVRSDDEGLTVERLERIGAQAEARP